MKKFSVLCYNIGGYELIKEIPAKFFDPDVDYVYVTDNGKITSKTWRVVTVGNLSGSVFDRCYQIRFFPFNYVDTDTVIRIDGSMQITGNLSDIVDAFNDGGYDAAVTIHPLRNTLTAEYEAWIRERKYQRKQADKILSFLRKEIGYDVDGYKGLYQGGFVVQRNTPFCNAWNMATYDMLKKLATAPDTIERVNQTIWSAVLNTIFPYKKIMPLSADILNGSYLELCHHKTNKPCKVKPSIEPYMFNKPVERMFFGK